MSFNPWLSPGSGLSEASEVQDSYNTLLQRLTEPQPQTPQRPRIITKYDFMQTRQEKSAPSLAVPAPFTISTGLTVTEKEQEEARRRGGRSFRIGRYWFPLLLICFNAETYYFADFLLRWRVCFVLHVLYCPPGTFLYSRYCAVLQVYFLLVLLYTNATVFQYYLKLQYNIFVYDKRQGDLFGMQGRYCITMRFSKYDAKLYYCRYCTSYYLFVRRTTAGRGLNLARAVEVAPLIQVPGSYSTTAM